MKGHGIYANHAQPGSLKTEWFADFVRQVSPEADPTSVLLFVRLLRANNQLIQAAEKELHASGLSWAKFRLLMNLHHAERHGASEGMQPSELSEMQGISRNTASALISGLERERLITRELHGKDHRRFVIRLTTEGRKVLKTRLDSQFRFVSRCFDDLSQQERRDLAELLGHLTEHLKEKSAFSQLRRP